MGRPTPLGSKIGINSSIGSSGFVVLSNASVVNPSGEQATVVSTSASDSSAGTGAQKVKITYFDTSFTLNTETVTMNGIIPVSTVAINIFRIEAFEVFQVGSGQFAAGTITLKNVAGTSLFAQIDSGSTTFNRALHFVAPGNVANMIDVNANCPTSSGVIFLIFITRDNAPNGGNQILIPDIAFTLANSTINIPLSVPAQIALKYPVVCDARQSTTGLQMGIAVKGLAAGQTGIASFHFIEV